MLVAALGNPLYRRLVDFRIFSVLAWSNSKFFLEYFIELGKGGIADGHSHVNDF